MSTQERHSEVRRSFMAFMASVAIFGFAEPSRAAFIGQDNFSDGDRTVADNSAGNGGGPGLVWFSMADSGGATTPLTIATDDGSPGIGGGNSLNMRPNSSSGLRPVVATFAPTTLGPEVGDKIVASMDIRFRSGVDESTNTNSSFRVGLYNSNLTPITADGQRFDLESGTGNDFGYFARIPIGNSGLTGNTSARLSKEVGAAAGVSTDMLFGADNSANTGSGVTELGQTASFPITIGDLEPHRLVFSLERTAAGVLTSIQVDGTTPFTAEDTNSPFVTFDEFAMTNMRITTEWRIDNVVIQNLSSPDIPEPTTMTLFVVAMFLMIPTRVFETL